MKALCALSALVCFSCGLLYSQHRLDYTQMYEVALVVMPLTGAGTAADPRRPMLMPSDFRDKAAEGLVSWNWQPGDNEQVAIVEIVARDKETLRRFTSDSRVHRAFERGVSKAGEVERELRLVKKNFSLQRPEVKKP